MKMFENLKRRTKEICEGIVMLIIAIGIISLFKELFEFTQPNEYFNIAGQVMWNVCTVLLGVLIVSLPIAYLIEYFKVTKK